ncbi:ran-specific GTPase-activating protein-like [Saccoglossus kowalevskii]|uniref:Ran-specific GTPase-activating protein-like n=1 Tax=Saccoglossus kowalevskii TaxID=10224 RepID=A0ABM0MGB3_SACKO|nr:PREDICTED: ran-specific GTPase-activating protein-like [Saccoglossus kowalevskii]
MELLPNCGSDRAWVWTVLSDYADEEAKPETLAIRFANSENAQKFKTKFEECQTDIVNNLKNEANETDNKEKETEDVAKQLEDLTVKDSNKEDASESKDNKVEGKTDEKDKKSEDKTEVKTEETKDEPSDDTKEKKDES